jgi:hypothetical protein
MIIMYMVSLISTVYNLENFCANEPAMDEIQELSRVLLIINLLLLIVVNSLGIIFRPKWHWIMLFSTLSFIVANFLLSYIAFYGREGNDGEWI